MIVIAILLMTGMLFALNQTIVLDFGNKQLGSEELPILIEVGKPKLPFYPLAVLLPFGEEYVSAESNQTAPEIVGEKVYIDFARQQIPISQPMAYSPTLADPAVYENDALFPGKDWEYLGTQFFRGYGIAYFNVYPFQYNPVKGYVQRNNHFTLEVNSVYNEELAQDKARFVSLHAQTQEDLARLVHNPELASDYQKASMIKTGGKLPLSDAKKMIIITGQQQADWFEDYATWRTSKGISTGIYTTSYIYANYDGVDNADKVRNFIIDAYTSWTDATELFEYVILGGDDEIIPERGVYGRVWNTIDRRMPSDIYYSNLDGDWNANGNNIYGEMEDEVDMISEVHIGRFTAETQAEFGNIMRKTKHYVENSTFSNNIVTFFGENLNNNPVTWGGDYKDEVYGFVPNDYAFYTQYERDETYGSLNVWDAIQRGVGVMNHMGHANENFLMGQGAGTVQQWRNTEYGFLYTQGCYPAAFDERTSKELESVGEHMVMAQGGLFAFIGNTRYGWYMPGSTDGASQYFDRQFFRGLYQQGRPELGKALTFSREQNLNNALVSDVMRWCFMEVVLFGDPSVAVKLPDHDLPMLECDSYVFDDILGDQDGVLNPGDVVRFFPNIENLEGWATAYDVRIVVTSMPEGMEMQEDTIIIPSVLPGQSNNDVFFTFEIPLDTGFGVQKLTFEIDSTHPTTGLTTGSKSYDAYFDITLVDSRFPWETDQLIKSAPMVLPILDDGANAIVLSDTYGKVNFISSAGESFNSFEAPLEDQNIMQSAAYAELEPGGEGVIVFAGRTGDVYGQTLDGELVFEYQATTSFPNTPVIADIDGDGYCDVIVAGLDKKLYVIDRNGDDLPGFPLDLGSVTRCNLAVGELEEGGGMKIIVGTSDGDIFVVGAGGIIDSSLSLNVAESISGEPVILPNGVFAIASNSKLYIIQNGEIIAETAIDSKIAGGLTCADINRDGEIDLVFNSMGGRTWVVSQSGETLPGFPVLLNTSISTPPLIADLDGDGYPDILAIDSHNSVFALTRFGESLPGFPFTTAYMGSTPATLIDFERDGNFKLINGYSGGVLVINIRRPSSAIAPWTTYRGALNRQASYAATGYVSIDDETNAPQVNRLLGNYPNPFNPQTTLTYTMAKPGEVEIDVYNLKGQHVKKLVNRRVDAGTHSVVWDGRDNGGRSVSSGVYLYRMKTDKGNESKKMLLMK
ncbi:MAG: C25 family cysteine peptidase [Candidatus Cloacimonetes bacterium]|nr:C25 family cysteine peptidase [Candidatus Cloacimonadota bacterium]